MRYLLGKIWRPTYECLFVLFCLPFPFFGTGSAVTVVKDKHRDSVKFFQISFLFVGDEIRRLVVETIIPFATEHFSQWRIKRQFKKINKISQVQEQEISDSVLEEYDQFDDYLEMVMQFGVSFTLFKHNFTNPPPPYQWRTRGGVRAHPPKILKD